MKNIQIYLSLLLIALAVLGAYLLAHFWPIPSTIVADAQATPTPHEDPNPLVQDASEYATQEGVSLEEVLRRLNLQYPIGALGAELESGEPETFAGLWIEHQPRYRVVAAFTRDADTTLKRHLQGSPLAGIVEAQTAKYTLKRLSAMQQEMIDFTIAHCLDMQSDIDVMTNSVELYVIDPAGFEAALAKAGKQLPPTAHIVEMDALASPLGEIQGPLMLVDGCLRVQPPDGRAVVLAPWFHLEISGSSFVIRDKKGRVVARPGDDLSLGGGDFPVQSYCDQKKIPAGCSGPYVFIGLIHPAGK